MLRKLFLWFLMLGLLWAGGLLWFISRIPSEPAHDSETTDVIVVLTGGGGRLEHGIDLLAAHKGKTLFISGVQPGVVTKTLLKHTSEEVRRAITQSANTPIILGHDASNTIGNAEETRRWLEQKRYTSIRLVTSAYHMPRSISEFKQVIPGIMIVPDAVFTDEFPVAVWWLHNESRMLVLSEYHKYLIGKARHLFISNLPAS